MAEPDGRDRDRALDEFERLLPLFGELARLDEHDAERHRCRERLIIGHLPIVEDVVQRYADRGVSRSELMGVGVAALVHAIDRFDPDSGDDFPGFAVPAVMGEVSRFFRDCLWPKRTSPSFRERLAAETGVGDAAARPPIAADVASRLGVSGTYVAELLATWEPVGSLEPEPDPNG
ncbi:sigma factor [Glycomyces tritici]|uniref:Sigma factor n=1 Tax=Glycomyces tritici TaxID=2665176 RepID=A0ABT7YQG9_9ACTN|nr:sigma factor [Glycomyces tritici]MDN3240528.1 sigma factor [Glycomyces tritici]